MPQLNELERVWVAAILDCEGAIQLDIRRDNRLWLHISVSMNDLTIPRRLKDLLGGGFQINNAPNRHYRWTLSGWPMVLHLLHDVKGSLMAKGRHLEILETIDSELLSEHADEKKLYDLIVEYKSLSRKGYRAKNWPKRVEGWLKGERKRD